MRVPGLAVLLSITTACAALGAPAPKDPRKPTDPPGGEWEVLTLETNGRVLREYKDRPSEMTLQFTPKKWVVVDGKFPLKDKAEYYKNGDVFEIELPDSGRRGIWKIDGDTLLLCFGGPGADRPVEFTAPKDSKRDLWIARRKAKK